MHILVATDGTLDPEAAADAVARWHAEGDAVTIFTAMNIPTDFLRRLGESGVQEASTIALEAGQGFTAGDRAAERLAKPAAYAPPAGDSPVMHALAKTATSRTEPIAAALEARGIKAKKTWITTENKTAKSVLMAVRQHDAELLIIGSHGHGRFDGLLGSTGTKLVRQSPVSVLILRNGAAHEA
jgi:nucleotide-binding universal stress UspA family protein